MRITVIGATGRTGRLVVAELLRRGHTVIALVRDPARLGAVPAAVEVVPGSVTDEAALAQALVGSEAVVSAVGPTDRNPALHTPLAHALVDLMGQAGVTRFIGISGAGVDAPGDRKGRRDRIITTIIQKTGGALVRDKASEYGVYAASPLEWTLVRPPRLLDGDATGRVFSDAVTPGRSSSIRRADLAAFVVECLEQHRYVRQAPFVCAG